MYLFIVEQNPQGVKVTQYLWKARYSPGIPSGLKSFVIPATLFHICSNHLFRLDRNHPLIGFHPRLAVKMSFKCVFAQSTEKLSRERALFKINSEMFHFLSAFCFIISFLLAHKYRHKVLTLY